MDVNSIEPGVDFAAAIDEAIASCDVLLALIGPNWVDSRDEHGQRRLDDAEDFVVLEIAAALRRNVRVLPVLLDGASPPRRDDLPEALIPLARRNAMRLDHETFRSDVSTMLDAVANILGSTRTGLSPDDRAQKPETQTHDADSGGHDGRPGDAVSLELLAALRDPDPEVRTRAIEAAGAVGDPAAVGPLSELLDNVDPDLGRAAVMALGRCGARAVDTLVGRLADDHLADAAVCALATMGAPAVDRLAEVLRGPQEPAVRARAVTALRGVGAPAVGALVAVLETADAPGRSRAGGALAALGDEAVPALVEMLERGSAQASDAAAELLAEIGDPAPAELLWRRDPAAPVRRRVAQALSGVALDDARGPLLRLLIDADADVRAAAAASLARHGPDGLDLLVRAAVAEEDAVAETALRALAAAGPDAVRPLLDLAVRHPDRAAGPLRAIGTVSALLGLAELGVDPIPPSAQHVHHAEPQQPPA